MPRLRLTRITSGASVAAALVLPGCAERRLVSAPSDQPSTATWVAVWLAGTILAVVVGVLLTRPAWARAGGARVAVWWFTFQAGTVVVAATVLAAVAVRSWQLVERDPGEQAAESLLRISRIDGDTGYFALMVVLIAVTATALTVIFALAARFARGHDAVERWVAFGVLCLELAGCGFALGCLAFGLRGWPFLGPALATPIVTAALVTCWPRAGERLQP